MKKQPIYLLCRMADIKNKHVQVVDGYVVDLITDSGLIVKIGLNYQRPFWNATHYETGISCTLPVRYSPNHKGWKNKEDLLEALRKFDFEAWEIRCKDFNSECRKIIQEYKEGNINANNKI